MPLPTILPREPLTEATLIWAKQQTYTFADQAAQDYASKRNLVWQVEQSYYNLYGFRDNQAKPSLEQRLRDNTAAKGQA